MTEKLLSLLREKFPLQKAKIGAFSTLKAGGMRFTVDAYEAEGLGHVSVMQAKGFFGLMRMDTLMIVPKEKDLPLYSYDRIFAMGNDTLIVELYDTLTAPLVLSALQAAKDAFSHLTERDPGVHWYDGIKLPESISKKGKKNVVAELDALTLAHFRAYLDAPALPTANPAEKAARTKAYVDGLLEKGGPSTDVFKKELGPDKTEELFRRVLFGTE